MTRIIIAQLTKDADDMEARIKRMLEMEERGFWPCENAHETAEIRFPSDATADELNSPKRRLEAGEYPCPECSGPLRLVKRSEIK
jgi:hypothetical protein